MQIKNKLLLTAALLGTVFTVARCGKNATTDSSGENVQPTLTSLYNTTLSKNCVQCHDGTVANNGSLNFSDIGHSYTTLQSFVSGHSTLGSCNAVQVVKPSDSDNSYIVALMVAGKSHSNFGGQTGCTPYPTHAQNANMSAAEQSALVSWIQSGAANN